jgi:hypothetical protein
VRKRSNHVTVIVDTLPQVEAKPKAKAKAEKTEETK